jgi:hypothetical protein
MRVGIVGDSQSEGLAPFLIPLLEGRGDRVVGTATIRGMSLANMRSSTERTRAARAVADRSEALVVILGGNNQVSSPERYRSLVSWFLNDVADRPREIWWVGPAASVHETWGARHAATRSLQQRILPSRPRVTWIDAWPMTRRGIEYAGDRLHFTRDGYRAWAPRLVGELHSGASMGLLIGAGLLGVAGGLLFALVRR